MNKSERTARLVDAIGGGICPIHGKFIGTGKYHLRACPKCDIEAHYSKKRWFLTVDWCNRGKRGIFCNINGNSFSKETQHTEDEMWGILDAFSMVLNPQSIELSEDELKEYKRFHPLAEYSNQYGIALKATDEGKD